VRGLALTPELVLRGYCVGAFPMADSRHGDVGWYSPDPRAILPLEAVHVRRSLQREIRREPFRLTADEAFEQVIAACAQPRPGHPDTWINPEIEDVYTLLHHAGIGHSLEAWELGKNGKRTLVGGIYGLALGGAFFGESMFSRRPYASQICLVALARRLRERGFTLFDVQFTNPHLEQFGVVEIPRDAYMRQLTVALTLDVRW
jgi:leucyl/phenylalanyl-tRNA--protein transferase